MKNLIALILGAAVLVSACGTNASDSAETALAADAAPAPGDAASLDSAPESAAQRAPRRAAEQPARRAALPARPISSEVTIPAGTTLPLALTSSVASDTSVVEDSVTAELTRAIEINGREVLPAGTRLSGSVTQVDDSGRVKGRASIAFRFTSMSMNGDRYDVQSAPYSHLAPATKGEDATKIGIGAGAGAIIGGLLGGKDGAAKGAVVGGGAGTGVVLATKGKEVRLGPGADVTTQLTAPLTVRVR